MKVKQVIIIRKDLNMRRGKQIAQGAHASMAVLLNQGYIQPKSDIKHARYIIKMNDDMQEWLSGKFTKICVSVNSEKDLFNLHQRALKAKLPCSIIQDAGLTEFKGIPTYTAVAIGPAEAEEIDKLTGDLKLL